MQSALVRPFLTEALDGRGSDMRSRGQTGPAPASNSSSSITSTRRSAINDIGVS